MSLLNKNELSITVYEDESIDLNFGSGVPAQAEELVVRSFIEKDYVEIAEKSCEKEVYSEQTWELKKDSADGLPYWHPRAQAEHRAKLRAMDRAARMNKLTPRPKIDPKSIGDGTGRKYIEIPNIPNTATTAKKSEDKEVIKFDGNGQWSLGKSNYGPKRMRLYNEADNAKRKQNNADSIEDLGSMGRVKVYGAADPRRAQREASRLRRLNRKQPVKVYTQEEIEAFKEKRAVNKSLDWSKEEAAMNSGVRLNLQATDEQLFGAGVVTQEQADTAQLDWNNKFNSFFNEVTKPVERQDMNKSWGSRGPISNETLSEEEMRISSIPVDPRLVESD